MRIRIRIRLDVVSSSRMDAEWWIRSRPWRWRWFGVPCWRLATAFWRLYPTRFRWRFERSSDSPAANPCRAWTLRHWLPDWIVSSASWPSVVTRAGTDETNWSDRLNRCWCCHRRRCNCTAGTNGVCHRRLDAESSDWSRHSANDGWPFVEAGQLKTECWSTGDESLHITSRLFHRRGELTRRLESSTDDGSMMINEDFHHWNCCTRKQWQQQQQ